MNQAFVTIAIPFDIDRADAVEAKLDEYTLDLRDTKAPIRAALRRQGIHFMTIGVVRGDPGEPTHLLFEISADGTDADALRIIQDRLSPCISEILAAAGIAARGPLADLLKAHQIRTRVGLFGVPGLNFCGTPGMSVNRILDENALARDIRNLVDTGTLAGTPLQILRAVRAHVAGIDELKALLAPEPLLRMPAAIASAPLPILTLAAVGLWTFFWPLILLLGLLVAAAIIAVATTSGSMMALFAVFAALFVALLIFGLILGILYFRFRRAEEANHPDDLTPDRRILAAVGEREDWSAQNHLYGISRMHPGRLRRLALRAAFWAIAQLAARQFRPGFLADIGSIHFARWVLLPKTDKLLFFSNYGGSWESYLEDFITKAANGLTGVWSNTVGFPRAENLFQKGATDGDRFKRWARRQQIPTRFWYSAYPSLTTQRIRISASLRQGLATASTEDEAAAWLSLVGSSPRPETYIEAHRVQTLVFGGLKTHPFAACLLLSLPNDTRAARDWVRSVEARVTFGDEPPKDCVHILSLAANGLRKLGLAETTVNNFPFAFLQGAGDAVRSRILADTGDDKPATWLWGNDAKKVDAAILVYCSDPVVLAHAAADIEQGIAASGGGIVHRVTLAPLETTPSGPKGPSVVHEPFGFADGISQPIVRGTRRWMRQSDAIHAVNPGEFILGYPDNRGFFPPSPTVPATSDPDNILDVIAPAHASGTMLPDFSRSGANSDRDFGRNGTFLVIRQLEQDVEAFNGYLANAANEYANHPGMPKGLKDDQRAHWIGAKMVGRWKDGTSLVRSPSHPGSGWNNERDVKPDNEFLFGAEDPLGERCPYGAHVRRSNPRDTFVPGSMDSLAIVNRHRMLRVGRFFAAGGSGDPQATKPGLLFMCLNGDIERQFEFVQQTWSVARQFRGLENEVDPILTRGGLTGRLTVPTASGPLNLQGFPDFVRVRGGGYFFVPGKQALRFLAS